MAATPNLVPDKPSTAPDYFCTWNVQGYACSYTGTVPTRAAITEANLFGRDRYQNWLGFFPQIRKDLIFVMDDSWDVPANNDQKALGRLQLDEGKFPGFRGDAVARLSGLTRAVQKAGWKGLGGWVCAQECGLLPARAPRAYWEDRLRELGKGGLSYMKVDWGKHDRDESFRQMLAELKPKCAPRTVIESAMIPGTLRFAETYRTYDVEVVISAPDTLSRLTSLFGAAEAGASPTILNCEDEVYIGAGLGCAYGVMRHPFAGALPSGRPDFVFPVACRDLKNRLDEVTRAVRWHRIAPPFALREARSDKSSHTITDRWTMAENESWVNRAVGSVASASAPAIIARGLPLPDVACSETEPPFVVASRHPNGCVSVATIGRALGREYRTPLADVRIQGASIGKPVGVFGRFKSLTLTGLSKPGMVWAQDLASDRAVDISKSIQFVGDSVTIPGPIIEQIGLSARTPGDVSDPGLVLRISG